MTPSLPAIIPTSEIFPRRSNALAGRRAFIVLASIALVYAFLAGLRTVSDFDLGWQLATGRCVAQHHHVPSVDVLSYTAHGEPWTYPIGGGLIFYAVYLLGGFALISWIGAAACCGTVALLLRRGSAVSAGIAVLAVPLIAYRTAPRADMFTVVLFAAFLSLLWENHQTGRAPLWLLPLLMLAWVNLHFGFAAGLGLVAAYIGTELLETILGADRRHAALQKLRRSYLWFLCTALATLANPWGWGIYRALLRQQRANPQQQFWIAEWSGVPLNWSIISNSLSLRQTRCTIYLLLAIAVVVAVVALLRARWGAGLLLLGSAYPAVQYVRMGAVFACIVVVIGGYVLTEELVRARAWIRRPWVGAIIAGSVVALLALVAGLRCFDLVSDRHYFRSVEETTFGAGLGWWFPQQAAEFIQREKLPGEVFNTYDEGGYLTWRLGPERRDYIDGRDTLFGVARIQQEGRLLQSPPDSSIWEEEVSRYSINTLILPLARYDGIQLVRLRDFCNSKGWSPVYLDEVSAVFVRRGPENEELIRRFPVNCETAALPARPPRQDPAERFNAWANAASVLAALGRNSEALTATEKALAIFPGSAFLRWERANLLFAEGRLNDSEREYLAAIAIAPGEVTWASLAESYQKRGRIPAAIHAQEQAARFAMRPYMTLQKIAYLYLEIGQPENALKRFDEAARSAPRDIKAADNGTFDFMVAQGRSVAWDELGDLPQATSYQEEAARLKPDAPQPLRRLAQLYERAGRMEAAKRIREHAASLEQKQTK
jgi:tetratricopeptide (TPR) repeat protein